MNIYFSSVFKVAMLLAVFLGLTFVLLGEGYIDNIKREERTITHGINKLISKHYLSGDSVSAEQLAYWGNAFGYTLTKHSITELMLTDNEIQQLLNEKQLLKVVSNWRYEQVIAFYLHAICACVIKMERRIGENDAMLNLFFILLLWSLLTFAVLYYIYRLKRHAKRLANIYKQYSDGDLNIRAKERFPEPYAKLASTFNQLADQVQSLLNAQQGLFQAVSHELRTPLARLRFSLDMTRNVNSANELRQMIGDMDQDLDELDDLVSELLLFVSLRSHQEQPDKSWLYLTAIIERSVNQAKQVFPQVEITTICSSSIKGFTNQKLIMRLIDNLLSNACKYGKGAVEVKVENKADIIEIRVADNGPGITDQQKAEVFKPFVRLDKSRSEPGVGLGLSIVAAITVQLDMQLQINQSALGGAEFVVSLPVYHQNITNTEAAR